MNWPNTTYPLPDIYFATSGEIWRGWQISLCLQVGNNVFRWVHIEVEEQYVLALLADWRNDPVEALVRYWKVPAPVQEVKRQAAKAKVLSLSDLTGITI